MPFDLTNEIIIWNDYKLQGTINVHLNITNFT